MNESGNLKKRRFRGAVFDFDGTLFDSMSIWETAGMDYLKSIGRTPAGNLGRVLAPFTMQEAAEYLKREYDLLQSEEEIIKGINHVIEDFYFYQVRPKAGAETFLKVLGEQKIKMCIATATDRYLIEAALKRCGLDEYFFGILTCSEVGSGKDSPDIYENALRLLETEKSETLVFEDAYQAALTAKGAGFQVAAVYDRYESRQMEMKKIADFYLEDFTSGTKLFSCI